ncbi:MAG: phosphoadenosine phosphosulfate reductase family protein [Patescibacteria group bacterium]|nr:phosphoadenosine phosphosulfate reductase family protein [Patescibacteria group bacterium]MDE2439239.1 phosphoadenosine phosphosulfate reductase family protein [Patescibacteria group bacterium]
MEDSWKEYFQLYAKSNEMREKIQDARQIISSNAENAYIAYSGGKDSIVLLSLASAINPEISVFHFVAGKYLIPTWLENQVMENATKIAPQANLNCYEFRLGNFPKSRSSSTTVSWYAAFYSELSVFKKKTGCKVGLIGLRSEESHKRKHKLSFEESATDRYPLKNWTWKDIWGYIISTRLPYPSSYDSYAELLGWEQARFVSFFDGEFDKFNSTAIDNLLMWREKHIS